MHFALCLSDSSLVLNLFLQKLQVQTASYSFLLVSFFIIWLTPQYLQNLFILDIFLPQDMQNIIKWIILLFQKTFR